MRNRFEIGAKVEWHWGSGRVQGRVVECFERRVQRTIKGARIVRVGTPEDPAYLIETQDSKVLKRGSELSAA